MSITYTVDQFGNRLEAQDEVTAESIARGLKEQRERLDEIHAELLAVAEKEIADARAAGVPEKQIEEQLALITQDRQQ